MNTVADKQDRKTLIVVLGMHRSGTSVIARAMQALGGELGERLMPPVAGVNDKGFFEDVDIHAINEELLQGNGLDWYSMTPIEFDGMDLELLDRLQNRAITVLREKCEDNDVFVLKDPRLTRLVPFWQPVFDCMNARVIYVVAVRNPISVVKSLSKVHRFEEEKSYVLWLTHVVAALEDTRNAKRVFVDYDSLMDAPAHELSRVSEAAALPLNVQAVEEFEQEFLEGGLRNTRFAASDLDVVGSAPSQVKIVFEAMRRAAAAEIDAYGPELDDAAESGKRYLDSIAPLLRYEWRLVEHIEKVTPALGAAENRIRILEDALHAAEVHATATLRASEEHAAATLRASEEHGANLLRASEAHAAVEIGARDQVVITLQQELAEIRQVLQQHLDHLEASQRYANDLKAHTDNLSEANAELYARCEGLENKVAAQERDLQRSDANLAQVFASTSWRITAPLRAFRRAGPSRVD